jgi:hypothetical protein
MGHPRSKWGTAIRVLRILPAGGNLLRVMAAAEKVSVKSRAARPASSMVFTEPTAP